MRQAFGVSRLQNQQLHPSGLKADSSIKKNYGSEVRQQKLGKIYEEQEPHELFGHRYKLEDHEFLKLYEATKEMVAQQLQFCEPHEMAADLILRYDLITETNIIEEQKSIQVESYFEIPEQIQMIPPQDI